MAKKLPISAADFIPPAADLDDTRAAAAACRGCDLYKLGTRTVFGEGTPRAQVMFVGEQPGDQEDKKGRPFVGPAGKLLDRALEEAGIDRKLVYVTNVVKHFKWVKAASGTRRLHKTPSSREIAACTPWLQRELELVKPKIVVALGATAAQALMGKDFRLTKHRGEVLASPLGVPLIATVHPSSALRAPDDEARRKAIAAFIADVKTIAAALGASRRVARAQEPAPIRE